MLLFTVGPVMMFDETLKIAGSQLPYFRTDEFSEINLESERILKKLLGAQEGSKVAFLTTSGTGAMDAVVSGCFDKSDKLLIINGGSFGHRFVELAQHYDIPFDSIDLQFGEELTENHLSKHQDGKYTALLLNLDETSTGQLYDIKMISKFCRDNGMYLIVDAISAFLADPFDMQEDSIDAVIISSQKALSLSPGLSAVITSERLYQDRIRNKKSPSFYLDLNKHFENQVRGQTPFTPAVGTLLELNQMLRSIDSLGISTVRGKIKDNAEYFRKGAASLGLKIPQFRLSNAVTPIIFESDAQKYYTKLKNEYGLTVTPSGGDLKDKVLRVGHIGNLTYADYDKLLKAFSELLK